MRLKNIFTVFSSVIFIFASLSGSATPLQSSPPVWVQPLAPTPFIEKELVELRSKPDPEGKQATKEAHYLFWLGKYAPDESLKVQHFEQALHLTTQERKKNPKDPGALWGWALAQLELIQRKNAVMARYYLSRVESTLLNLKQIDSHFEGNAADRGLGRLYQLAPTFLSLGSPAKARESFQNALKQSPNYPANLIYYADFLASQGELEAAQKYATQGLESNELSHYPIEKVDWMLMAHRVLEKGAGKHS